MRDAPPFEIEVGTGVAWRAAVSALCLAALASAVAWLVASEGTGVPTAVGVVAAASAAVAAAASLLFGACGRLRYDGAAWSLRRSGASDREGDVRVAVDTGRFLLLRFRPNGSRSVRWLPVVRTGGSDAWHLLRCAVYSARPGQAVPPPVRFVPK